jgi:superfamily I DNA and/or RNA helicase/very-short-patch-repair endonuclease
LEENMAIDDIEYTNNNDSTTKFAFDSLEAIRKRLLDLSGRNSLLNFKHPKTSCVRIIDELPNQIYDELLNGKKFTFIPVPEPTELELIKAGFIRNDPVTNNRISSEYPSAEQWAKHLGLVTSFDLETTNLENPEAKHQDTNLQTLLYAPDLEARLRSIRGSAESAIEESGTNILYLTLGFLEWYENKESDVSRLSPLFTLPVQIERTGIDRMLGVYRYTIQLKDDGLISNITLREKLANDFGLILPTIEDETSPESYYQVIEETILKHQPKWKIRKQVSLILLNFSKQAMYEDLDPKNWPENENIEQHPLIQKFFSSNTETDTGSSCFSYEDEYLLDEIDNVQDLFPLIYDADSSQHSAIVDVVNGNSLVIEGPPGSGKSQTITNIIAACIANGQKVLFVAEKMAALDVVKSRLDAAGLGDFCLELHSHKTNKLKILNELGTRLSKQDSYISPYEITAHIERYEDLRNRLNSYAIKINSVWANTGLTIHHILQKATRLKEQFEINPDTLKIDNLNGENLTYIKQKKLVDLAHTLESIYKQVAEQTQSGCIQNHYWYGVEKYDLNSYQIAELIDSLENWSESLHELDCSWRAVLESIDGYKVDSDSLSEIEQYVHRGLQLPKLKGGEQFDELDLLFENKTEVNAVLDAYVIIHNKLTSLQEDVFDDALVSGVTSNTISDIIKSLKSFGVSYSMELGTLGNDKARLEKLFSLADNIDSGFNPIREHVPNELKGIFFDSYNALSEIVILIKVIQKLSPNLWRYRNELYEDSDLDKLITLLKNIAPTHRKLDDLVYLDKLPSVDLLKCYKSILDKEGFFKWFSSDWRLARKSLLKLFKIQEPNKKQFNLLLTEIITYAQDLIVIVETHDENPMLGEQFKGANTNVQRIAELRSWYKLVREEYGIGFGERVKIGNSILTLEREFAMSLLSEVSKGLLQNIELLLNGLNAIQEKYPNHPLNINRNKSLSKSGNDIEIFGFDLNLILDNLSTIFKNNNTSITDVQEFGHEIKVLQLNIDRWSTRELNNKISCIGRNLKLVPNSFSENDLEAIRNTIQISEIISGSVAIKSTITNNPSEFTYRQIVSQVESLQSTLNEENQKRQQFIDQCRLNLDHWLEDTNDKITNILKRNQLALEHSSWLNNWLDYISLKNRLYAQGFENIIDALETSLMQSHDLQSIVNLVIHHQLATEIFAASPDLSSFIGLEQNSIQQKFKEYDAQILKLQRQKIAFKASRSLPSMGVSTGKVKNLTEVALIRQELGKKMRHIPVRSLLKRASSAIQTLKPCFMMSPMSVAQYLESGKVKFDLIIMDEASQIRPEDALGAIARGTTLVVVGDPKQLPPTNFFNKILNEDFEEDQVGLQVSESILEAVMPMFNTRRLRWHYRSKHESLIAFSNKFFYDSDLIIFPSPFKTSPDYGIKLHRTQKGRFVNRRNVEEAHELVKSAANHLMYRPDESLGIVAMNSEQKDEIEKQLLQLTKDDTALLTAYEKNKSSLEPLFIKNLENVQGDERDVIYISMTYGPEQLGGRTMQRFGPINTNVGWRRLNVLFTRSKKRMHIFSSMTSGDVLVSSTSSKGVQSLKSFLEYAETGHLHSTKVTGKVPDSDFEVSVISILEKHGYECEPQLGVAGYFLDIAVRDPGKSGRFLMGIECDGATYHSAKSARDRDHLRQEILESLGWKIRRIWSTDWFKHPATQIQPILNELEKLRTPILEDSEYIDIVENPPLSFGAELESSINNMGIRDRLLTFDNDVIKVEFPMTGINERLLRDEMLNALLDKLPTSKVEFQEVIPAYLRTGTATCEAKFLDKVLSIIADYA